MEFSGMKKRVFAQFMHGYRIELHEQNKFDKVWVDWNQ